MIELIATTFLFGSLGGMIIIIWRKIPALNQLPAESGFQTRKKIFNNLKNKLIKIRQLQTINLNKIFQKLLSKIGVLILKLENKTFSWLQKLREESQKKKLKNENYWQELKKNAKNKKIDSL